jgi:hypothetical protein
MPKPSTSPVLLREGGLIQVLRPLPKVHSRFDEAFLQDILAKHPEILPVSAIRADVGSLVCIGREVSLPSGAVDNLYLSTGGYPVLVETKLWRNPQARREVLAQTLDYIKDITRKNFDWLQEQWKIRRKESGNERSLMDEISDAAEQNGEEFEEAIFYDRVNRALSRGHLLAMIVGDGVESRLQDLVDDLCKHSAHLRYTLSLCELAFFEMGKETANEMIIVPRIVGHVEPVERAYIRLEFAGGLEEKLTVYPVVDSTSEPRPGRGILSAEEFYLSVETAVGREVRDEMEKAIKELIQSCGLEPDYKAAAIMLKLPDLEGEAPGASLIAFEREGRIYNPGFMRGQLKRWEWPGDEAAIEITREYWTALNQIDRRFAVNGIKHKAWKSFIPFSDLQSKWAEIHKCIVQTVEKIRALSSESQE